MTIPRFHDFALFVTLLCLGIWELLCVRGWLNNGASAIFESMLLAHLAGLGLALLAETFFFQLSPVYRAVFFGWASGSALLYLLAARDSHYVLYFLYAAAFMNALPIPLLWRCARIHNKPVIYAFSALLLLSVYLVLQEKNQSIPYNTMALVQLCCQIGTALIALRAVHKKSS